MTAIHSPRRILGDRDVNKPTISSDKYKNELETCLPPGKRAISLTESPQKITGLSPASPLKISGSKPTMCSAIGNKRIASVLDDGDSEAGPRKKIVGGDELKGDVLNRMSVKQETSGEKCGKPSEVRSKDVEEAGKNQESLSRSASPSSLFDTTRLSQNTTVTEPDDQPIVVPTPHGVSQRQVRENANTLRLRLRVAMYKVRTNQTDIPLCRLQIRPDPTIRTCRNSKTKMRTVLPSSRPQQLQHPTTRPGASPHLNPPSMPCLPASPSQPYSSLASPSKRSLTAPVLPSILEGEVSLRASRENDLLGDCNRDLKSNIFEGRAADGLLSLKEMR